MAARDGSTTVGAAVAALTSAFRAAGLESAGLDARRLVVAAAGLPDHMVITHPERRLDPAIENRLVEWRRRRLAREPVSRIVGSRVFYGRDFAVSPAVLDPRPETESIVEAALALIDGLASGRPDGAGVVLDIGVGTGAIVVTLLAERPRWCGVGVDVSEAALAVAQRNAETLGVADRLKLCLGRTMSVLDRRFDLIVANPPYIPADELARLDRDVRDYDPRVALDGGADGLDVYREIFEACAHAGVEAPMVLEVGDEQADAVVALGRLLWPRTANGNVRVIMDLAGRKRGVVLTPHLPTCTKNRFLPAAG